MHQVAYANISLITASALFSSLLFSIKAATHKIIYHYFYLSLSLSNSKQTAKLHTHSTLSQSHHFPVPMAALVRSLSSSLVLVLLLLISFSEAKEILVGGKADSWNIPSSQSDSLNQWAQSSRFRIGDSLVLNYDKEKDSVLQVTKEAYVSCNTSDPIAEYKDGNTKVKLDRSGPFYFISGAEGHCVKGQKLIVVVLAPRLSRHLGFSPAPAPSPGEFEGPAVAPTSSATSVQGSLAMAFGVLLGFGLLFM